MRATRRFRISAANIGPNRFHQNRTVSWLMSIPRSASSSSTLRRDSGYRTYIITTRRMTSGELLKYRNGLLMPEANTVGTAREFSLTPPYAMLSPQLRELLRDWWRAARPRRKAHHQWLFNTIAPPLQKRL